MPDGDLREIEAGENRLIIYDRENTDAWIEGDPETDFQ